MLYNLLSEIQDGIIHYLTLEELKNLSATCCGNRQLLRPLICNKVRIPLTYLSADNFFKKRRSRRKIRRLTDTKVLRISNRMTENNTTFFKQIPRSILNSICKLTQLTELDLCRSNTSMLNLQLFCDRLSGLKALRLSGTTLKDTDLYQVQKLVRLEILVLDFTAISDGGLAIISTMETLTELSLKDCWRLTDEGMARIVKLSNLKELNLSFCESLRDGSLHHLTNLTQLERLNLTGCVLTEEGFRYLGRMVQLTSLILLSCKNTTDEGLLHLYDLTSLKEIDLSDCPNITSKGISVIESLPLLETFYCRFNCML